MLLPGELTQKERVEAVQRTSATKIITQMLELCRASESDLDMPRLSQCKSAQLSKAVFLRN